MIQDMYRLNGSELANSILDEITWAFDEDVDVSDRERAQKTKKWINTPAFIENPITFLVNWRDSHKNLDLMSYARFSPLCEHRGGIFLEELEKKARAFVELARMIMKNKDYPSTFVQWLRDKSIDIIKARYSETSDPVIALIDEAFKKITSSQEFYQDIHTLRDIIVGDIWLWNNLEKIDLSSLKSLQWVLDKKIDLNLDVDVITNCAQKALYYALTNYYDFTLTNLSKGRMSDFKMRLISL